MKGSELDVNLQKCKKSLCQSRNIGICTRKKLGFARGSIYKWDKNIRGIDKVKAVADELKKPIE